MFSPPEILSDQKIFHRRQPCPFEYFLVYHFSIQVIPMIVRRCRIMKACSFFTSRLYIVQASAPYRRVDGTIARYILPLTRMDTCGLKAQHSINHDTVKLFMFYFTGVSSQQRTKIEYITKLCIRISSCC